MNPRQHPKCKSCEQAVDKLSTTCADPVESGIGGGGSLGGEVTRTTPPPVFNQNAVVEQHLTSTSNSDQVVTELISKDVSWGER